MTDTLDYIDPDAIEFVDVAEEAPPVVQAGGIAYSLDETTLNKLGADVVRDYEADKNSRREWEERAEKALSRAAQEEVEAKDYPFPGCSNVSYPLLTVAALQFQARAYPAIVKNDEAVAVKVFGVVPEIDQSVEAKAQAAQQAMQEGQPVPPEAEQAVQQVQQHQEALEHRRKKTRRAKRVADYMNYQLFYENPSWEADTDAMLFALPIVGGAFRKTFVDPDTGKNTSRYVPALNIIVPQSARDLETTPRITEEMHDVYPYQIKQRVFEAHYLEWELDLDSDEQEGRKLIEQYRYADLDDDGLEEPYIITVDCDTAKVLRIEPGWVRRWPEDLSEPAVRFERYQPYTLYSFIPDPKGRFYPIGFGHLLDPITDIVNTTINQMIDAGHAQIAGGGFISGGLRLQGAGQTNTLRWRPGEYKVVNAAPGQVQASIYERTFPNPSSVAMSMLELMLGAAKEITATSDVITGQAPATAPVGTTMALIEQGLQVFTAIYKRIFRAAKNEYRTLYEAIAAWGDAEDYLSVIDDPEADFEADFTPEGKDVVPVSDPTVATKMQQMGKAQFLLTQVGQGLNDREIRLRAFRAFDIDDPESLIPPPSPPPGAELAEQAAQADIEKKRSDAAKNLASAQKAFEEAQQTALQTGVARAEIDSIVRGLPGLADASGNPMGVSGPAGVSQFAEGGMG